MKSFALSAVLVACASATGMMQASRICVSNIGGYDLNWWIMDQLTGNVSAKSPTYPIGQQRCMDIAMDGLLEGAWL